MARGGRTKELKQIGELLGVRVIEGMSNDELKRQIEAKIVEMFASKGIKPNVTIMYGPNTPGILKGRRVKLGSTNVWWDGCHPQIKSADEKLYAAHTAAVYGNVVK